jgi:hypothetical protein
MEARRRQSRDKYYYRNRTAILRKQREYYHNKRKLLGAPPTIYALQLSKDIRLPYGLPNQLLAAALGLLMLDDIGNYGGENRAT